MMSSLKSFEFQCPQFVDFLSGIEGSPKDEVFGSSSPGTKDLAEFKVPQYVSKPIRSTHFQSTVKESAVKAVPSTNVTDSVKLNAKKVLSKRLSRSDGAIHLGPKQPTKKKLEYFPCHKRSLSESDLRPRKKILATTPMCLKRTIQHVKTKKIKSTEEMELEKIAELQQQMRNHLRANEITMRRQKIKQTGNVHRDITGTQKKEKKIPVKIPQKDFSSVLEKINIYAKNAHTRVQKEEVPAKGSYNLHAETLKKINLLKKSTASSSDRFLHDLVKPVVPQRISEATFAKLSINAVLKQLPVKKTDAHPGLLFNSSVRKPAIRPFNFQDTIRDLNSNSKFESRTKAKNADFTPGRSLQTKPSESMQTPRLIRNKENTAMCVKNSHCLIKSGKRLTQKKTESRFKTLG